MDSTAIPFANVTSAGLSVERLKGDAQFPVAQLLGIVEPVNSSRHCSWNAPFVYDEYWAQLMYSWTGRIDGSSVPPKVEFPAQVLKCIDIP